MQSDNRQGTWAQIQAAAIVEAARKQAGEEGADLAMTIIGKLLVSLVHETQIRAQDIPGYPGFETVFSMLSDHIADFSQGGK